MTKNIKKWRDLATKVLTWWNPALSRWQLHLCHRSYHRKLYPILYCKTPLPDLPSRKFRLLVELCLIGLNGKIKIRIKNASKSYTFTSFLNSWRVKAMTIFVLRSILASRGSNLLLDISRRAEWQSEQMPETLHFKLYYWIYYNIAFFVSIQFMIGRLLSHDRAINSGSDLTILKIEK